MKSHNDLFNDELINSRTYKRRLLPWWMKGFIWIFLIFGAIIPIVILFGILGYKMNISIYGIETNSPLSKFGSFLIAIFILKGIVSYGLWAGKRWAVTLAIVDAILGILICLYTMFIDFNDTNNEFSFRLELLILIPYLIKLVKIGRMWNHSNTQSV